MDAKTASQKADSDLLTKLKLTATDRWTGGSGLRSAGYTHDFCVRRVGRAHFRFQSLTKARGKRVVHMPPLRRSWLAIISA